MAVVRRESTFWKNGKEYELVTPEGGWGYMIGLSIIVMFISSTTTITCFGMIYNDFLNEIGEGTRAVTLVGGVFAMSMALSGFLTSAALKRFTMRQVGFFGCFLNFAGSLLLVFVGSINDMLIASGLLQAGGFGIMIPIVYTSFNNYFTRLRVPVLSFSKCVIGLWTMVVPLLIKISMQEYGFRGTLLLLCGLSLHNFIAITLIQPVEWHRVLKEVTAASRKDLTSGSTVLLSARTVSRSKIVGSFHSINVMNDRVSKIIQEETGMVSGRSTPSVLLNDNKFYDAVPDDDDENMQTLVKATSIMSLGSFGNNIVEPLPPIVDEKGKIRLVMSYLDLNLLKDPIYTNICLGMSVVVFSDMTYFTLLPLLLYQQGWDNNQVAIAISLVGGGDMVFRIVLGAVSKFKTFNGRHGFLVGIVGTLILRTALQFTSDYMVTLGIITLLGGLRCMFLVLYPIVMAEYLPMSRYASGMGLFMLIYGLSYMILGPIVGIIRDVTQSYWSAFYMLNAVLLACTISWTVEFYVTRKKSRVVRQDDNVTSV